MYIYSLNKYRSQTRITLQEGQRAIERVFSQRRWTPLPPLVPHVGTVQNQLGSTQCCKVVFAASSSGAYGRAHW